MRHTFTVTNQGAVSDGPVYSDQINDECIKHSIYIEFFPNDDFIQSELVDESTMTGTVTFAATPRHSLDAGVGEKYIATPDSVMVLGSSDPVVPHPAGRVRRVRATFSGITGATHYRLIVHSSEG